MKKKIKELTLEETKNICMKCGCKKCPLFVKIGKIQKGCIKEYLTLGNLEMEIEIDE